MVLLILGVLLLVSGVLIRTCSGRESGIELLRSKVTLVFTQWWEDELAEGSLELIVKDFEKAHPEIKIRLDKRSYREMEELFLKGPTDATKPSDILALDPRWFSEAQQNNTLEHLSPYMNASGFTSSTVPDSLDATYSQWALPLVSCMIPFFYNIKVLEAAGFDRPPKNWTDFMSCARALTDKSAGRYGAALSLSPEYPQGIYIDVYSWIWASGALMIHEGKPSFSGRSITETLDFLKSLHDEGLLSPAPFIKTREEKLEEFISGKIGMMLSSVRDIDALESRMETGGFGISSIPASDKYRGKTTTGLTTWYAGISQQSTHKDAAWAFLSFLSERAPSLVAASHAVPGYGNSPDEWSEGDPLYSKAFEIYESGDCIQEFTGLPKAHDLDAIVWEELYNMFERGQSVETTAEIIQSRWNLALGLQR
jgi:multiple sugar transport system substrate-binding protein